MKFRSFCFVTSLFLTVSSFRRYSIEDVCKNMRSYYHLLHSITEVTLDLEFQTSDPSAYLHGRGSVVLTPNIFLECYKNTVNETKLVKVLLRDTLTIRFPKSSWVIIEDCDLDIDIVSTPIPEGIEVKLSSIKALKFTRATTRCSTVFLNENEVIPRINEAFDKYLESKKDYNITGSLNVFALFKKQFLKEAFLYHMSRLKV